MSEYKDNNTELITFPKTVVFGRNGFLGNYFYQFYQRYYPDSIGTTQKKPIGGRQYFDLLKPNIKPLRLRASKYRYALIAAGVSNITNCEIYSSKSWKINVVGTLELVRQLREEGIKPIVMSSDYVFDGEIGNYADDDIINPINQYGKQKAEVENIINEISDGNYLLVRISKVFSLFKGDNTLLDEIAFNLINHRSINMAYDQIFSPILIDDLIRYVTELQKLDYSGHINICPDEYWSRYDISLKLANALSVDPGLIKRISIDDLDENFKRPKNTSMKPYILRNIFSIDFTPLDRCINTVANNWKQ